MNIGMKKTSSNKSIKGGDTEKSKEKVKKDTITSSKNNNPKIKDRVKELEKSLGINTNPRNTPGYLILAAWLCVLSSIDLIIIVGLILASIGLVLSFRKSYKNSYKWNKAITLYFNNDIQKARTYLDKLSSSEKEGQAYKEMLKLLNKKR